MELIIIITIDLIDNTSVHQLPALYKEELNILYRRTSYREWRIQHQSAVVVPLPTGPSQYVATFVIQPIIEG